MLLTTFSKKEILVDKVKHIRRCLIQVASADTSYSPEVYVTKESKLTGHCFAAAYVVQCFLGGEIITGTVNGERHGWNKIDGIEFDVTSCQFGGDGLTPLAKGKVWKMPKKINPRFLKLKERVDFVMQVI